MANKQPTAEDLAKQRRDRDSKAARQKRWRDRTRGLLVSDEEGETSFGQDLGAGVHLHLTDKECAALDMIAAKLYRDNPHDPANGIVGDPIVFPGRPAALRLLIAEFRRRTDVRRPASRNACAAFWRRECAFRKAKRQETTAEAPVPPWSRRR